MRRHVLMVVSFVVKKLISQCVSPFPRIVFTFLTRKAVRDFYFFLILIATTMCFSAANHI